MMAFWRIVAWLVALAWVYKFAETLCGIRKVPDLNLPEFDAAPNGSPKVVAIVPARNEAHAIADCLRSLLEQDYANLEIIAVDDRSTDSTGRAMDVAASAAGPRLRVIHIQELPPGWLGKTHAMAKAAHMAIQDCGAEYFLFTDGDVRFSSDAIRRSLARAKAVCADHLVLMPTMLARTIGESAVLSYMQTTSFWAMRPWRVPDPYAERDAVGVGAFNLIRVSAYQQIGGFEATPMEVLEDLYLGKRIKWAGLRQDVAFAPGMVTLHWAAGAWGIVHGLTKNIFAVFRFRPFLLTVATFCVALSSIGPAVFLILPSTRLAGGLALVAVIGMYSISRRVSRISAGYCLLLPVAVALVIYAMLRSMLVTMRDGGIRWRETFYDLPTLRRNMVRRPSRSIPSQSALK